MMDARTDYEIHIRLHSDATFGRGDGVAGLVDADIEHDALTGLPYLPGRTLKGLLVEECANLLYSVTKTSPSAVVGLEAAAFFLYGRPGSSVEDDAMTRVGDATLPPELRAAVAAEIEMGTLNATEVLDALTAIRRQSAIDDATGAPARNALRASRVLLRETALVAPLHFEREPSGAALGLLAACALALRRGGIGRHRGRGRLSARVCDRAGSDVTAQGFSVFQGLVGVSA